MNPTALCGKNGCRKVADHSGAHDAYPTAAWGFMNAKDKAKLTKAGFATPRGGDKGAYQNHVNRSNQVILPFERIDTVSPEHFEDGFVVRLFPEQYFAAPDTPKDDFVKSPLFSSR